MATVFQWPVTVSGDDISLRQLTLDVLVRANTLKQLAACSSLKERNDHSIRS